MRPRLRIGMAVIAVQVESGRSGNGIISRRFEDSNLAYMYGGRSIGLSVEGEHAYGQPNPLAATQFLSGARKVK
jgi:hypothetical protein